MVELGSNRGIVLALWITVVLLVGIIYIQPGPKAIATVLYGKLTPQTKKDHGFQLSISTTKFPSYPLNFNATLNGTAAKFTKWKTMAESYRSCLALHVQNSPNNINNILINPVRSCLEHIKLEGDSVRGGDLDRSYFKMSKFVNAEGDRKLVLLSQSKHCVTVTIGIGHDIGCEEKLILQKPDCQFFGADPVYDAGIVYKKIGTFFHIGVGDKDGALTGQIKSGLGFTDYTFSKNITGVSLQKFLRDYVKKSFVDYLWIDNEGPEFRMIKLLKRDGPVAKQFDICQINMEWHYDTGKGKMNLNLNNQSESDFKKDYLDFIKNTPYLPIMPNSRSYYFNFDSLLCFQKFFSQYFP